MERGIEVEITGIAAGGAGVGRLPDGRAVFVQRTAPDDRVAVRVTQKKRRWARAELLRVIEPGPGRREAPCPHYDQGCGGCTLEHLEYPAQLRAKAELVAEALRRIGGLDIAVPEVVASPEEFRYRNRVAFALRRLGGGHVLAGFHELGRPDRIVDLTAACLLPEEPIARVWGRLREVWGDDASRLPSGEELRLTLRATATGDVALLVEGGFGAGRAGELVLMVPGLVAVWHQPQGAEEPRLLAGEEALRDRWIDEELAVSGAVFLQVNRGAAELLEAHVTELVEAAEPATVVDAYCGVGLRARRFARRGARVVGIELDADAVREAERGKLPGTEFIAARVEDALPEHLPCDLVVVYPPRGGLDPAVPAALEARPAGRVVYVSCDPATLARDLRLMPGYEIASVRCFDLFPQTAHVETVVELVCATS